MITQWNVLARFRQLIEIEDEEAEKILPLCVISLKKVFANLRKDVDKDDIRILEAASCLTYYDYSVKLANQIDNITSFKAGDITVSQTASSLTEHAEKLKKDALIDLMPLSRDEGFVFMNV